MILFDPSQNNLNPIQPYGNSAEQGTFLDHTKSATEKKIASMDLKYLFWNHSFIRYDLYHVTDRA